MYKKPNFKYKNLKRAQQSKKERLYKRIIKMIEQKNIIFLTFTFNDKVYKKTSAKTQERYIKAFLNEQANEYILNCDYGTTNTKRRHFHALIKPKDEINGINLRAYKYGRISAIFLNKSVRFKNTNKDLNKCAEMFLNHIIKPSTQNTRVIFSRKLKKEINNI